MPPCIEFKGNSVGIIVSELLVDYCLIDRWNVLLTGSVALE